MWRRARAVGVHGRDDRYRANDLKLGQPVALKFLPEATAKNPQLLARFHAEVRIARQVSHPNVCRVWAYLVFLAIGPFSVRPPFSVVLPLQLAATGVVFALSIRFGVLWLAVTVLTGARATPLSADLGAWYTPQSLLNVAIVLALALWSFRYALGGRKVLKESFLDS